MGSIFSVIGPVLAATIGLALWFARIRYERSQKRRDILIGLHTEILAGRRTSQAQVADRAAAIAEMKMFGTPDRTDFVFDSIKGDISILPETVIYEVVSYYRLAEQSNLMTEDMRHEVFLAQPREDQRAFIEALFDIQVAQANAAAAALDAIEAAMITIKDFDLTRRLRQKRAASVR